MMAHPHEFRPQSKKLTSLSDQVYDHLRFAIISSTLQSGENLVELEIAAHMGTSQGPIRRMIKGFAIQRTAQKITSEQCNYM